MDAIGPRVRLSKEDHIDETLWWFDWKVDCHSSLIFYEPLRLTFKIRKEQTPTDRPLSALDFSGHLVKVYDGVSVPEIYDLCVITKKAVYYFYHLVFSIADEVDALDNELS